MNDMTSPDAANDTESVGSSFKRKARNYLLQPLLQIKLGLYSIILSVVFVSIFTFVLVMSFQRLFELILDLTDLREDVLGIINDYMSDMGIWMVILLFTYLALTILMSVVYTHRLVGPTVAFRRLIKDLTAGNYRSRITLRKNDAFAEVAEDLNNLAEKLERQG